VSVARETHPAAAEPTAATVARETRTRPGILTAIALLPIRFYRRFVSPAIGQRCRYYPSCSAYAEEAVRELGPVRGIILAGWRVLRCNPFSRGGLDPVADRRLFRPTRTPHESR